MKSTILKMILPVAAFALASAGAVSTASLQKKAPLVLEQGYIQTGDEDEPCHAEKMCSTVQGDFCTIDNTPLGVRVWKRTSATSPCNIPLYKP